MGSSMKRFIQTGKMEFDDDDQPTADEDVVVVDSRKVDRMRNSASRPSSKAASPWPVSDFETLRCELMTIQPHHCAEILATRNPRNRGLSRTNKSRYARQMRNGLWVVNGGTIVFANDGTLRDGQTRLGGAVEADVPLRTFVVFGVEEDVFDTIDKGRKRTRGDDLYVTGESHSPLLAATLGIIWHAEQGTLEKLTQSDPNFPIWDVLARHPDVRGFCGRVASRQLVKFMAPRLACYCYYVFAKKDEDGSHRFFEDLVSGVDLRAGDPVLLLRNRLIENRISKSRLRAVDILALTIKAWNGRRRGVSVQNLRWRNRDGAKDAFPEPI